MDDQNIQFDPAHAGQPPHVDMTQNLGNGISGAGAHKISVDGQGNIFGDDIV